jgi:hypothetical protein
MSETWKRCNACKREIPYEGKYYVCSVSTCNLKRTGLVFCSVDCWDAHLPGARHRDGAGAIEEKAPSMAEAAEELQDRESPPRPVRRVPQVSENIEQSEPSFQENPARQETEILVVASKVKKYIRETSGMNTSSSTMEALTRAIIALCDKGVENARADERKTLMDRDIPRVNFSQVY